jgi:hypothetical protein
MRQPTASLLNPLTSGLQLRIVTQCVRDRRFSSDTSCADGNGQTKKQKNK